MTIEEYKRKNYSMLSFKEGVVGRGEAGGGGASFAYHCTSPLGGIAPPPLLLYSVESIYTWVHSAWNIRQQAYATMYATLA